MSNAREIPSFLRFSSLITTEAKEILFAAAGADKCVLIDNDKRDPDE